MAASKWLADENGGERTKRLSPIDPKSQDRYKIQKMATKFIRSVPKSNEPYQIATIFAI